MTKITRLPSQAVRGNDYGRRPAPRQQSDADFRRQQKAEAAEEAYLIDGWQDDRRY